MAALVTKPAGQRIHCRWMIRRDMPEVLATERASFEYSWTEDDFLRCLRQRNCVGMVAEHDDRALGFMIYELHKNWLHILNFAVQPTARRTGVGGQMVALLVHKMHTHRRGAVTVDVRDGNLPAQLFFRACGFRAATVETGDEGECVYRFIYCAAPAAEGGW